MGRKQGLGVVTDTLTSDLNEGQEYRQMREETEMKQKREKKSIQVKAECLLSDVLWHAA